MLNWEYFTVKNLLVVGGLSLLAYVIFKKFSNKTEAV